ncbi:MAG: coproporphyrinogen-III oxidase family protein [Peptostreptococcus anaerobius]
MNKAIYIHIPFCAKKCYYCDFTSYVGRDEEINSYLDSLEKEMDLYMDKKEDIYSIFIGGGTPSLLSPDQLDRLFGIIEKKVNLESLCEYTIESNPGTLTRDKLRTMKKHGVNRLSMGLQAVQDKHLKFMGRIHDMDQFVESFELARQEGLENINVDLIFAFEGDP